jgi:hypothetical protein
MCACSGMDTRIGCCITWESRLIRSHKTSYPRPLQPPLLVRMCAIQYRRPVQAPDGHHAQAIRPGPAQDQARLHQPRAGTSLSPSPCLASVWGNGGRGGTPIGTKDPTQTDRRTHTHSLSLTQQTTNTNHKHTNHTNRRPSAWTSPRAASSCATTGSTPSSSSSAVPPGGGAPRATCLSTRGDR